MDLYATLYMPTCLFRLKIKSELLSAAGTAWQTKRTNIRRYMSI